MREKIKEFLISMSKIDWQPKPATFQLSPNDHWARHSDWIFIPKEQQKKIQEEIWRHYMLLPITDNGIYCFFGLPWKATEILYKTHATNHKD